MSAPESESGSRRAALAVGLAALVLTLGAGVSMIDRWGVRPPTVGHEVDGCTEITTSGRYVVTGDAGSSARISQRCIRIAADDVRIEGRGHALRGIGASDTTAVVIDGTAGDPAENVTVTGLTVTRWNSGIRIENASNTVVRNVTVSDNARGIVVRDSANTTIADSRVRGNLIGVSVDDREAVALRNVTFAENTGANVSVADREAVVPPKAEVESESDPEPDLNPNSGPRSETEAGDAPALRFEATRART